MANQLSNYWKYYKLSLVESDTYVICLMQPGFSFNRQTHKNYADISASECVTAYGYTAGGESLTVTGGAATQDNVNNRGLLSFDDISVTPTGGNISFCGGVIINTTNDVIIGFEDAGGTVVAVDGQPYLLNNISVEES